MRNHAPLAPSLRFTLDSIIGLALATDTPLIYLETHAFALENAHNRSYTLKEKALSTTADAALLSSAFLRTAMSASGT
jgi:hypothetical protein